MTLTTISGDPTTVTDSVETIHILRQPDGGILLTGTRMTRRVRDKDGTEVASSMYDATSWLLADVAAMTIPFAPATPGTVTAVEVAGLLDTFADALHTQDVKTQAEAQSEAPAQITQTLSRTA